MTLTPISIDIDEYPAGLRPWLRGAKLYDSSSSPEARVIFVDKNVGYFLKIGRVTDLDREYELTRYFHRKGLAAKVVDYSFFNGRGYLVTEKLRGDDCTTTKYLTQPERLAGLLGEQLAFLHSMDCSDCPMQNHTEIYLAKAKQNFFADTFDKTNYSDKDGADTMLKEYCKGFGYASARDAWAVVEKQGHLLGSDTILHGDYCLPNIILNNWSFSGFIDLDSGGVGDRHVDIFWGIWTLYYNLKTDKYRKVFIDAYGRNKVNEEILHIVAAAEVFG